MCRSKQANWKDRSDGERILGRLLLLRLLRLSRAKVLLGLLWSHSKGVKRVLARGALLRLISLHAHTHSHVHAATHHIHLLLLLTAHRHSLTHHRLEPAHHWLESTCSWLLLLLTWLLRLAHKLAERIRTWQVLGLELVSLGHLLLSFSNRLLRVELVQYRHFVVRGNLVIRWGC